MQSDALPEGDDELRTLVSAILSGECAEEIYLEDVSSICRRNPHSAAALRALLGRYHRLGRMSASQHQRVQATIERALAPQQGRRAPTARSEGRGFEDLTCDLSAEPVIGGARSRGFTQPVHAPQIAVRPAPPPVKVMNAASTGVANEAGPGVRVLHDRYELQQLLGRGGMASVYRAIDRYRAQLGLVDCFVAVKLVQSNAAKPASSDALGREFNSAQRLSHPNVVNVFDIDHDGDTVFYTMEMLSGERLSQVLRRLDGALLPRPYALAIIRDIGAAIAHAHARGVVHADLKPSNVMITLEGEVRVLDFGGASMPPREPWVSEGDAEEAYLAATPAYASCEQLERRRADPRDDIYALACIIYLLLCGRHPFDQLSSIEARARGLHARQPANVSHSQWRVLRRGLAWSREQQPQSVEEWLSQLRLTDAARALPPLVALSTLPAPRHSWRRSALVALAVLAAGAGVWLLEAPGEWSRDLSAAVTATQGALHDASLTAQPGVSSPAALHQPSGVVTPMPVTQAAPETAAPLPAAPASAASTATAAAGRVAADGAGSSVSPHVSFAAQNYTVAEGEPAARITIQRVGDLQSELNFIWWTEAGSAQPDVDYASLGRRVERMASGQDKLTVYVPIISSPVRAQSTQFQVAISDLNGNRAEGNTHSARATVTIDRGG